MSSTKILRLGGRKINNKIVVYKTNELIVKHGGRNEKIRF